MKTNDDPRGERSRKAEEFLVLNEKVRHNDATPAEHERWLRLREELLGTEKPAATPPGTRERTS